MVFAVCPVQSRSEIKSSQTPTESWRPRQNESRVQRRDGVHSGLLRSPTQPVSSRTVTSKSDTSECTPTCGDLPSRVLRPPQIQICATWHSKQQQRRRSCTENCRLLLVYEAHCSHRPCIRGDNPPPNLSCPHALMLSYAVRISFGWSGFGAPTPALLYWATSGRSGTSGRLCDVFIDLYCITYCITVKVFNLERSFRTCTF